MDEITFNATDILSALPHLIVARGLAEDAAGQAALDLMIRTLAALIQPQKGNNDDISGSN